MQGLIVENISNLYKINNTEKEKASAIVSLKTRIMQAKSMLMGGNKLIKNTIKLNFKTCSDTSAKAVFETLLTAEK